MSFNSYRMFNSPRPVINKKIPENDETSFLDASTVPTYEEFTHKTSSNLNEITL
jgi:hypothetical protein